MINTLRRLGARHVRIEAQVATLEVRDGQVKTRHIFTGEARAIACDTVVAALGNVANDALAREISSQAGGATTLLIGDCQAPRTMLDAIRDGRMAGRAV